MADLSVNRRNEKSKHVPPVYMTLSLNLDELEQLRSALVLGRELGVEWIGELLNLIHPPIAVEANDFAKLNQAIGVDAV